MKKAVMLIAFSALIISCSNNADKNPASEVAAYQMPTIELIDFDTKAADFIDKEVKVAGIVDHVCKHGGKKLFLVNDDADVHVESDTRFDDALIGSEVIVTGVVREFRVDEGYCLKMEEDNIKSHKEGETDQEQFDNKIAMIKEYRDEMNEKGVDHLSYYSLEYVSLEELPEPENI